MRALSITLTLASKRSMHSSQRVLLACSNAPKLGRGYAETSRSSGSVEKQLGGPEYRLVYRGPKNAMVLAVKSFSLATSSIGVCGQAFIITAGRGSAVDAVLIGGLGLFALATPLLLHLLTSSYVFWLYVHSDGCSYRAVTKNILLRNRFIDFRVDQVALTETGIPFANLSVSDAHKKLFVDPSYSLDLDSVSKLFHPTGSSK